MVAVIQRQTGRRGEREMEKEVRGSREDYLKGKGRVLAVVMGYDGCYDTTTNRTGEGCWINIGELC